MFAMRIFRVLRCMYCNQVLAFLVIARLAEVDCDATVVKWFSFQFKRSKITFIPSSPKVTRKRAEKKEVTVGSLV